MFGGVSGGFCDGVCDSVCDGECDGVSDVVCDGVCDGVCESAFALNSSFLTIIGSNCDQQRIMVRIVWAVNLQLRPPPKRIWIPPVGMVDVTSSDVSGCSHQLFKAHPL